MAMRARTADRLTVAQFEKMPQFWERYELIDGKVEQKPVATIGHGRIARAIMKAYDRFDPDEQIGEMVGGDVTVKLADDYAPLPDVSFWKAERRPANSPGAAPYPDLAVEIWSASDWKSPTKARRKVQRYLEAGVSIVWVINPDKKLVEVYKQGFIAPVEVLGTADQLDGWDVIPGFKLPVVKLFE